MSVKRIVPDLATQDIATAAHFYAHVLGLQVAMEMDFLVTLVSPSNPTAQITLQSGSGPNLTIEVDDVDAVHEKAQTEGAEIVYALRDEPWGVRRFFVRAPEGTIVNVMSHAPGPS